MCGLTDKTLGSIGLVLSMLGLAYLFLHLMIVPVLPLNDDNPLKLGTPVTILVACGVGGFLFLGTLAVFTLYTLHKSRMYVERTAIEKNFVINRAS